jgi:membrane protease YdiL (CAAX protease family)
MLAHRSWSTESVLFFFVALLTAMGVALLISMGLEAAARDVSEDSRRVFGHAVGTLFFHAATLGLLVWFLRQNDMTWNAAFGFGRPRRLRAVLLALVVGLAVFPLNLTLLWVSQRIMEWFSLELIPQSTVEIVREAPELWHQLALGCVAVLTAPLVEELLFRGMFYTSVKQAGYPGLALWVSSLVFAATHGNLMTFLPFAFFGIVLALLYEYTDNLLAPIVTHALFNAANFTWLLLESGRL